MKINKKLSAAITLSLMLGVYGCASAEDPLYGAESGEVTGVTVNAKGVTTVENNATNTGANYTVESGNWNNVFGGYSNVSSGKDATNNKVTIKKDAWAYIVFGGQAQAGNANNNEVIIYGNVGGNVYGAQATRRANTATSTEANNNIVTIEGTVSGNVYGGYANKVNDASVDEKITASGNKVTIEKDAKVQIVYGGYGYTSGNNENSITNSNYVELSGSAINVFGGFNAMNAEGNEVFITETGKAGKVVGGQVSGNASGNKVTVAGTVSGQVIGSDGFKSATGNTVTVSDTGSVGGDVFGAQSAGDATGNTVTISGTVSRSVRGGDGETSATGNTVIITGKATGPDTLAIFGGYSGNGNATGNTVTISGTVNTIVYGGASKEIATDNTVTISGTANANVYGALSDNYATGNTVTISGTVNACVYGGYSSLGMADTNTINLGTKDGGIAKIGAAVISYAKDKLEPSQPGKDVLNVYGSGHTIGEDLYATKANLNFYIKAEDLHAGGKTMVDVTRTAYITESTINAGVMNVGQVDVGDKITLLSAGTLNADATLKTGKLSDGLIDVDLQIAKEGNSITATAGKAYVVEEPPKEEPPKEEPPKEEPPKEEPPKEEPPKEEPPKEEPPKEEPPKEEPPKEEPPKVDPPKENNASAKPNAKSPVETMAAAISLLNAGSDMLATSSIMNAEQAVQMEKENAEAEGGMTVFTTVSGSNKRINSGSHVDMKAWNANLGLAKESANKSGKFLFAPVVEYGRGSYDSYLDNGVHGEGDSHFVGGGLLAKQTFNSNWYVDGSVRAGRMKSDYKTSDIGTGVSYDNSATYYAAHLGAGKVVKMTEKSSMDYYGKLFYSHQNSSTAILSTGHTYEFDAVDSFRTLLGLRYSQKAGKTASFYTGLAWQHEFDSECNATVRAGAWSAEAPAPSIKGDTGILEVGYKFAPGNSDKFDVDFGAAGYVGKQRGGSLKLNMQWKF